METNPAMVVEAFIGGGVIMTVIMWKLGAKFKREADRVKKDLVTITDIVKDAVDEGTDINLADVARAATKINNTLH